MAPHELIKIHRNILVVKLRFHYVIPMLIRIFKELCKSFDYCVPPTGKRDKGTSGMDSRDQTVAEEADD